MLDIVTVVQLDYVAIQLRIGMLSPALAGRSARALRALAPAEGRGRPEPHRLRASVIPIVWVLWIGWGMFNMGCMLTYRVFILQYYLQNFLQDMSKYFFSASIFFENIGCCMLYRISSRPWRAVPLGFQPRSSRFACFDHSYSVGAVGVNYRDVVHGMYVDIQSFYFANIV